MASFHRSLALILLCLVAAAVAAPAGWAWPAPAPAAVAPLTTTVFINEIHYDNTGTDTGEAIEIAAPSGTSLTGWNVVLYNGNGGASYDTDPLGAVAGTCGTYDLYVINYASNGIQNGAPDGLALVDASNTVVQFLSYEGTFAATNGPANGMTSTDIGVSESGSGAAGNSLQLAGTGTQYSDFAWQAEATSTFGACNTGQTFGSSGDTPPTVSSSTPANNATGVAVNAAITINFSESVDVAAGAFAVECPTATPILFSAAPALPATGTTSVTLTPSSALPQSTVCTVTVDKDSVTDKDGTPENMAADHVFSFTTAEPPTIAKIHAIQGSGSAVVPGTYTVEAIVTGDYQGATGTDDFKLDGFFIQEEDADIDGDSTTSEGIFVYCAACPTDVVVGDKVQVTGAAGEFFNMSQLSATTAGSVVVVSSGNTLPTPVALALPVPGVTATDLAGAQAQINAYYEQFEGMLVKFPTTLSVTEYFELSRYGQVVLAEGGRFRQFTDANAPATAGYTAHQIDLARRKVILDDDSNQQNHALMENPDIPVFHPVPGFSTTNYVRGGDTITDLTGVLHWSFAGQTGTDAWRIRPVMDASNAPVYPYTFTSGNPRGAAADVGGNIKVASFNVLNYFTTLGSRGANSTAELDRQAAKIVAAFAGLNADVIGVMEIENNNDIAIADLVSRLNASAGAGTYAYIATGTVGADQITVGIIYKPAKVTPVGAVQTLTAAAFTDPNSTGTQRNRPAVAQTFDENVLGERFTVVVNHLKSKGSCPSSGPDTDQGDGQGCWNATRAAAAAYMVGTWIPALTSSSGDPDILIVGDLNAYRKEDPIANIEAASYNDLLDSLLGAPAYGYVFDGQLGYLDHALSNATLTPKVSGVSEWHINGDEANLLDYNDTVQDPGEQNFDVKPSATTLYEANAYRSSDHDPVIIGLCTTPTPPSAFSISRSGSDVSLQWTPTTNDAAHWVWRSTDPYFTPTTAPHRGQAAGVHSLTDAAAVGDPAHNYFYTISACGLPGDPATLQRVGEFDFALVPGS